MITNLNNIDETLTNNNLVTIHENVNSSKTMLQQTINVQAPRLHPKKRKFNLSELEDGNSSATTSNNMGYNNPVTSSSPPEKISVVYKTANEPSQQTFAYSNPQYNVVTQVAKNTGEIQQIIKRQLSTYR